MCALFGDPEFFKAQNTVYRNEVLKIAEEYKWSALTTLERVKITTSFSKNSEVKNYLTNFIH
jgi:hypothetical protein